MGLLGLRDGRGLAAGSARHRCASWGGAAAGGPRRFGADSADPFAWLIGAGSADPVGRFVSAGSADPVARLVDSCSLDPVARFVGAGSTDPVARFISAGSADPVASGERAVALADTRIG